MSVLPYILPVLTAVSLFLYIFSAERAWLPKEGTTEWIVRSVASKRISADIKFDIKWKDIVICAGIIIVYCAVQGFYKLPLSYYDLTNIISCALLAGLVYIFAQILFKNRVTAFFASAMTVADILLATTFNYFESSVAIILQVSSLDKISLFSTGVPLIGFNTLIGIDLTLNSLNCNAKSILSSKLSPIPNIPPLQIITFSSLIIAIVSSFSS